MSLKSRINDNFKKFLTNYYEIKNNYFNNNKKKPLKKSILKSYNDSNTFLKC